MEIALLDVVLSNLAVTLGALVQAVTGVGAGFVVVPMLAMIDLSLVPAPLVFASMALSTTMAVRGWEEVDLLHAPAIVAGILPGSCLGALLLTAVPLERTGQIFGVMVLVAVVSSAAGLRLPLRRDVGALAGAVSGVLGTAAGIGGPVLALLYQDQAGPRLRATLALLYASASVVMLCVLFGFDRFGAPELAKGVAMMPGFVLGYVLSPRLAARLDHAHGRVAVWVVSAAAALVLIARSS